MLVHNCRRGAFRLDVDRVRRNVARALKHGEIVVSHEKLAVSPAQF